MDISSLRAFLAVAEQRSFSAAADQLFLTQPAVSKRISNLESLLGVRLFDRIGRRIRLTEEGETLLPRAEKILREMDDAVRAVTNLEQRVEGSLTIGTSHHVGLHRLPPVLKQYIAAYPDVALNLEFMDSEEVCQQVERGRLELGIITLPSRIPAALSAFEVWRDRLELVTSRDHALAETGIKTLSQLQHYRAILPAKGTYTYNIISTLMRREQIELENVVALNYLETIKMLVTVGMGWSLLPHTMIDDTLVRHPLPGLKISRPLGLVWHNAYTPSNAAKAMKALLHS